MTAAQYRILQASGEPHILLDVREPRELASGAIGGHVNIPLGELEERLRELAGRQNDLIVCLCRAGVRSRKAVSILHRQGFLQVTNFEGGYLAWQRAEQADTETGEAV